MGDIQWNFLLGILFIFLFFKGQGGCEEPPPDFKGMKILGGRDIATKGTPVSNEENIIYFGWQLDKNDNSFSVNVNLFLRDQNTHISWLGSKTISVTSGQFGKDYLYWDGKIIGSRDRKIPVPPGDYSVRLRYFDVEHKYVWHPITVRANTWDDDNDDFSNAVEDENAGIGGPATTISYEGNTYYYNKNTNTQPPMIPMTISSTSPWYRNRGTHDYSLARGTVSSGSLTNGLRIANNGTGYQYYRGGDLEDTDNWGILEIINLVERVARAWRRLYPDYPIITSMDMSKQNGGDWRPDHTQHQNGLDVDMRYIRKDGSSGGVNFDVNPGDYSRDRTQALFDLFQNESGVYRILVDSRVNLTGSKIQIISGHHHHFHLQLKDPDGNN